MFQQNFHGPAEMLRCRGGIPFFLIELAQQFQHRHGCRFDLEIVANQRLGHDIVLRAQRGAGQKSIFTQRDLQVALQQMQSCQQLADFRIARLPAQQLGQHGFGAGILPFFDPARRFSHEIAAFTRLRRGRRRFGDACQVQGRASARLDHGDDFFGFGVLRIQAQDRRIHRIGLFILLGGRTLPPELEIHANRFVD